MFTDVFEKALKNVIDAWKEAFDNLESGQAPLQLARNWNLDTGEDMDAANNQITYWMA
ncbi:hypothetical protein HY772_06095 [Candidatus Woesearchaeota archaeon]|nr:hypothetical protein [Candidatus Woesearchaeota archaeon]